MFFVLTLSHEAVATRRTGLRGFAFPTPRAHSITLINTSGHMTRLAGQPAHQLRQGGWITHRHQRPAQQGLASHLLNTQCVVLQNMADAEPATAKAGRSSGWADSATGVFEKRLFRTWMPVAYNIS